MAGLKWAARPGITRMRGMLRNPVAAWRRGTAGAGTAQAGAMQAGTMQAGNLGRRGAGMR